MDKKLTKKDIKKLVLEAQKKASDDGFYLLRKKDIKQFSTISAEAFENYPLFDYICNGKYLKEISLQLMKTSLKDMIKQGVIYADSEKMNGFIIILPPSYKGIKALPFIFNGGLKVIPKGGPSIIKRLMTYETFAMKLKNKHTKEDDWYIYNLTVRPKHQGKGIGKRLFKCILEFFDEKGINSYLETNNIINTKIYEALDFKVVAKEYIPNTKVSHFGMYRESKKGSN